VRTDNLGNAAITVPTRSVGTRIYEAARRRSYGDVNDYPSNFAPLAARRHVGFTGAMEYQGQRATIMGLGHFGGGAAAARWLIGQGAVVTISDMADENALADSLPLLADLPVAAYHLGGHREEDFRVADLIVVNPAVRPDSPWLCMARNSGARLCTELELFIENCPGRIIGVTGSNGKSTTAAMIASILNQTLPSPFGRGAGDEGVGDAQGQPHTQALTLALSQRERGQSQLNVAGRRAFLGGNIGGSLLGELPCITADDWVVLEISSFQLWHSRFGTPHAPREASAHGVCRVHGAVVTGCSPNHLDWHPSFADYVAAKQRILIGQMPDDFAVLNTQDAEVASWLPLVRGRRIDVETESTQHTPCADSARGVCGVRLADMPVLSVPGEHNRLNAACAAAAAMAAGSQWSDVCRGLETFRGLPQRLELIATIAGREFYNDSTATTPESTVAALRSLDRPVWLLAGGKSKGFDFGPLAAEIVGRVRGAAFFGSVRKELLERVVVLARDFSCTAVETMSESLDWCWSRSQSGDALVLSPACASTDQFRNFRQRGEQFAGLVQQLSDPHNR
jgi:UDP-N-acetylmuramoylalanine--D-glutamate ligase